MAHGLVKRESVESEMHKSEDQSKIFVYTKKRGYDVTRNPYLNKVTQTCAFFCVYFVRFFSKRSVRFSLHV